MPERPLETLLFIGLGGFAGAIARYGVAQWAFAQFGSRFPWGTMIINVSGSFLLALLLGWAERHVGLDPRVRLFLAVGFFGAYTTFSTFAAESAGLYLNASGLAFIANVLATNVLCIGGALLGLALGHRL